MHEVVHEGRTGFSVQAPGREGFGFPLAAPCTVTYGFIQVYCRNSYF